MKMYKFLLFAVMTFIFLNVTYSQTPLSLNLTGGANVPMGEFKDVYKSGLSIEAGVFYAIPLTGIDLTFTAGYNGFTFKNDYFTNLVQTKLGVGVDGFNPSWTATDVPIMVGAKYSIPLLPYSPYVWGELGVHFLSFKDRLTGRMTGNTNNPTTINWANNVESGSETAFGYAIGAGITMPLVPKISIDLNIKYNSNGGIYSKSFEVFRNSNSDYINPELKNMTFLTVRAGILISL
jgi:opacity protein-like surface antigen